MQKVNKNKGKIFTLENAGKDKYRLLEIVNNEEFIIEPVKYSKKTQDNDIWLKKLIKNGYKPSKFKVTMDWWKIRKNRIKFNGKTPEVLKKVLEEKW